MCMNRHGVAATQSRMYNKLFGSGVLGRRNQNHAARVFPLLFSFEVVPYSR
jgi:hypothetical protein